MSKLFIGVCNSQHHVPSGMFWSFINIRQVCFSTAYRSGHPWDIVRNNRIIAQFLKSDCDIMAKMDIDQIYPDNYFEKMIPLVDEYKVVGPLIYDRHEINGHMPLLFESYDGLLLKKFDITGKEGIVEVPYPHTNLFYHREVLEKIPQPCYEAFLREDGLERANHVDLDFIQKIHDAGYKTYIDLDTVVGHMKIDYEYGKN